MSSWHSYSSSYALGHAALAELFLDPVTVEEKVDGSQFSFGKFHQLNVLGELVGPDVIKVRSKGREIFVSPEGVSSEKMFQRAIDSVLARSKDLTPGWTYRAEYLQKPKHNALAYDRVPKDHLIIFDIAIGEERYLPYFDKMAEAERLGLEVVPLLFEGWVTDVEQIKAFLDCTSVLGGQKIEGIVAKNYTRYGRDKKILFGKYVSDSFKEVHDVSWKEENPKQGDMVTQIVNWLRTPARWSKAVQHLEEAGVLQGSPRDIGSLFIEVPHDVKEEFEEEIKAKLFAWAWPQISRGITAGMADWYKERLMQGSQFADAAAAVRLANEANVPSDD
jgi:hypothetical protein